MSSIDGRGLSRRAKGRARSPAAQPMAEKVREGSDIGLRSQENTERVRNNVGEYILYRGRRLPLLVTRIESNSRGQMLASAVHGHTDPQLVILAPNMGPFAPTDSDGR